MFKYKTNRKIFRYLTFSNLKKVHEDSHNISDKNVKLIVIFCWPHHNINDI